MATSFVKRYLIAIDKYKWVGLATVLLTSTAAGALTLTQKAPETQFRATGSLALNSAPAVFSETGTQIQKSGQDLTPEVLLADNVIEATARRAQMKPEELVQQIQEKMLKIDVKVPTAKEPVPFSMSLTYIGSEKDQSIQLVGSLMEGMIQQSQLINSSRLRSRIGAIQQRLPKVIKELRGAESQLEQYNRREEADILAARSGTLVQAIAGSQEQQRQLRLAFEGVVAQQRSLEARLGLSADQAYVSSALSADPIIASLRARIYEIESQVALQQKDLRPDHPQMIQLRNQLQSADNQLKQRAQEVVGGNGLAAPLNTAGLKIRQDSSLDPTRQQMANNLVNLQTQREGIEQQFRSAIATEQQVRQEYATIPNKQLEQQRLAQQVALKKAIFDKMQAALVDAQSADAETVSSLRVERPPTTKEIPAAKPLGGVLMLLAGGGAGVLIGGGLIFLLSQLEGRYYTKEELQNALRQQETPLLEVLPALGRVDLVNLSQESNRAISILRDAGSPYLDAYERLRSNLRRSGNKSAKLVLVTSPSRLEGKSLVAYNLAIASARSGKRTLLVEADLRNPSQISVLGISPDFDANLEPLQYYGDTSNCIRLVPSIENLYIVPSTGPQQQPAAILESSEIRRLLEDARGRFDFVVIDSPSILRYNDAQLIEPLVDGILLVVRPGYTQASLLTECLELLSDSQLPFFGAVINGAESDLGVDFDDDNDDDLDYLDNLDDDDDTAIGDYAQTASRGRRV
jgi:capsular exopolysaccharide synthesis family protein